MHGIKGNIDISTDTEILILIFLADTHIYLQGLL